MSLAISPAARDLLAAWLADVGALKGGSDATVVAYGRDTTGFLAFQAGHFGDQMGLAPLKVLGPRDMRAWMAQNAGAAFRRGHWRGN